MARQDTPPDTKDNTDLGGMFYPTGSIVVAFPGEDQAKAAQQALAQGGVPAEDCRLIEGRTYASMARKELAENTGFLARLGKTDDIVRRSLEAAEQGAAFLLIHAPKDEDAARAMDTIGRVPRQFAYRYHSLAIEELK